MPSIERMEFKQKLAWFRAGLDRQPELCGVIVRRIWEIPEEKRGVWLTVRAYRFRDALPFKFRSTELGDLCYCLSAKGAYPTRWLLGDRTHPLCTTWPELKFGKVLKLWVRLEYEVPA